MGMIYLRGNTYWIKYYRNGKPFRESTKSDKQSDAKKLLKLREGQIVQGKFPGLKAEKTIFEELTKDYLSDYTKQKYKSKFRAEISVRHLCSFFEGRKASDIDSSAVNKYIELRLEQGAMNATINRELTALKRMFSLGATCTPPKVLHIPHIQKLKENNVRTGFFEQQDYLKIIRALPDHLKPLFIVAYFTGMRKGELVTLTWDKVNLFDRKITLSAGTTKNDEARLIFLAGELYDTIKEQYTRHIRAYPDCPYVFHKEGYRIGDFRKVWARVLRECGFKPTFKCRECGRIIQIETSDRWRLESQKLYIAEGTAKKGKKTIWVEMVCTDCKSNRFQRWGRVFHDNRRTGVRNLVRSGIPEGVVMKISGHKTRTIFERYNIVSEEDLKIAAERIALVHQEGIEKAQSEQMGTITGTIALVK